MLTQRTETVRLAARELSKTYAGKRAVDRLSLDRIVILSTHIVSDVEAIAGRVAIVAGGRLLYDGPPRGDLEQLYLATVAGARR